MSETSDQKPVLRTVQSRKVFRWVKTFLEDILGHSFQQSLPHRSEAADGVLSPVAMALLDSSDPDEIVTFSLHEILHATGMDAGMIHLGEAGSDHMTLVCQQGLPDKLVGEVASVPPEDSLIGAVYRAKSTLAVSDLSSFPGDIKRWVDHGYQSLVGAPILCDGRVLGVVGLVSKRRRGFGRVHLESLESAGLIIGKALGRAGAQKEMADACVTMRRLNRAGQELTWSSLGGENLDELARAVCEATLALSSMIVLVDEDGRVVRRAVFGYTRQALSAVSRTDVISKRCFQTKECVLISEPAELRDAMGPEVLESGFASCICLPLQAGNKPLGALWLNYEAPRRFAAWELEQLQALADRAARAIEDAHRRAAALEQAGRYRQLFRQLEEIGSRTELKDVLQAMADSARELLGARAAVASLSSGDGSQQVVSVVREKGLEEGRAERGLLTAESTEIAERLRSLPVSAESTASMNSEAVVCRMRGLLAVRLLHEEKEPAGFLMVGDRMAHGEFTKEDEELLGALARHGMLAIEQAEGRRRIEHLVEQYRALLDGVPVAVADVNEAQVLIAVNAAFERLTGFSREEVEGRIRLCDLLPEMEREGDLAIWKEEGHGSLDGRGLEAELVTKGGGGKRVKVLAGEVREGGRVTFCMMEVEGGEMDADAAEAEQGSQLERISPSLLAVLHDPLLTAGGHLERLLRRKWPEDVRETLEAIRDQMASCQVTCEAYQILARPKPVAVKPAHLNDLITSVADDRADLLRRDSIAVNLRLDANLPAVSADREQLSWVLGTLIENCRKAMRESEGERSLTIQTASGAQFGRLTISDTRPDIPADKPGSLFELSARDEKGLSQEKLALPACRAIIERHGWKVLAETRGDEGMTFVIEYPLPESVAEEDRAEPTGTVVESHVEEVAEAPAVKRILLADDESVVIDLLDYYLRSEGHTVEVSRDGRAALNKLKENDYDLIFCDVKMPGLSGPELFGWIEANKAHLADRIIFITGDIATPETLTFLNDPPKRWLEKPFDLTELRRAIARVLSP